MRGLMIRLAGRGADHGSMAPLFAVLLAGGVLLGSTAVVVDVGRVYAEREELQSGADAAALAAALDCATRAATDRCTTANVAQALQAARDAGRATTSDGAVDVTLMCGQAGKKALRAGQCQPRPANATGCVGPRPATANYVELQASTRNADGGRLLPYSFTQAVTGQKGVTVATCSRAGWGSALSVTKAFPVMISLCSYNKLTSNGTAKIGEKPADPKNYRPAADLEAKLTTDVNGCGDEEMVGLRTTSDRICTKQASVGQAAHGYQLDDFLAFLLGLVTDPLCVLRQTIEWWGEAWKTWWGKPFTANIVYLAVYKTPSKKVAGDGWGIRRYEIVGFAPFVVTGGSVFMNDRSWIPPDHASCGFFEKCLLGTFVKDAVPGPYGDDDTSYFGLANIGLAG